MESLNKRRSIRKYAGRDVSEELLTRLLREAERTQTMGNLQLYSVVVTRSDEKKRQLAPAHFNQPMVTEAPAGLRQFPVFHQRGERRAAICADVLQPRRRGGARILLPRHHGVHAAADNRGAAPAAPRDARGDADARVARREPAADRPPAGGGDTARRDVPRLRRSPHRQVLLRQGGAAGEQGVREGERQGDARAGVHRHKVHASRQRGHVADVPRRAAAAGLHAGLTGRGVAAHPTASAPVAGKGATGTLCHNDESSCLVADAILFCRGKRCP